MYTDEEKRKVIQLSRKVAEEGCVVLKEGLYIPSKTGLYVYKYDSKKTILRKKQVKVLGDFFSKDWYKLLNRKIQGQSIKSWLNISDKSIRLAVDPKYNVLEDWTYYFGIDLTGPNQQITDFNSDRATVVGFQDEFCKVFSNFYYDCKFSSFYQDLIPLLRRISGKSNPRVFILTYPDEVYLKPIEKFAQKFGFTFGSIDNFDPNQVDLILRQVKSEEIIENEKKYKKLLDAIVYIPMINPLGSFISGHKGWLTILSALGNMPSEWFPRTWLISGDKVLNSNGQSGNLNELKVFFIDKTNYNNRKNFVLKKGFGAGGRSVYIGEDLKRYQWDSLWYSIPDNKSSWVLEEKLPRNNLDILIGDWKSVNEDIQVQVEPLNLIERIYSVNDFKNFSAEVFGKNSNKVNASGYTFPVCF